ncbi:MAG: methylenetetrahydrofolate reductase, partial [Lachnospiraceae bacterium]|nr:methylenetetrahydrofolate reductase [Lachnospiraceae bacterium]
PNAGYPKLMQNRVIFMNNEEYFVNKECEIAELGADIVGGCCGTTPEYIRRLSAELDNLHDNCCAEIEIQETKRDSIKDDKSFFANVSEDKKLIAVELAPPLGADDEKIMDAANLLKDSGVDVVTFPDSPSGRTRADSVLMAVKIHEATGMQVMPHICCRDKNAIAIRSQILGAYMNNIYNLLILTGDPVPTMIRQNVKSVFNFDSVGLMKIVSDMNGEHFSNMPVTYGGVINYDRLNLDVEIRRVRAKMDAGARFFFTQPIFSSEDVLKVKSIKDNTNAKILCGIMPLVSRNNAVFIKNEMTGIRVTDEIVDRFSADMSREESEAEGVKIAVEIMDEVSSFTDGYYFTFPFNRVYLLDRIIHRR